MIRTERIVFQKKPNLSTLSHIEVKISKKNKEKKDDNKYKLLIKRIANQLKKRIFLPKCKIIKIYMPYRTLILRIASGLKKTAKKLNFWDKNDSQITEKDINEIQELASTACKIIQKKEKKKPKKKIMNKSKNTRKKSPKIKLSLLKKEEEKKLELKDEVGNKANDLTKKVELLKNMDISKNNIDIFLKDFYSFLNSNNIEIQRDNKLPTFSNKKDELLLTKKEFWIKYIIYISNKYKNELNIYNFLNFIELFYLWCDSEEQNMDFIVEIKLQIYQIFDEQKINNFLFSNKLQNFDEIFERYKNLNSKESKEKFIEIKINDNIDINNNCECPLCKEKGYINKVIEYNKINNQILLSQKNNFYFLPKDNYYIGFEKDKTLYNNKANIEYSILSENKYDDNNIFNYLSRIEKGKAESEKKKYRSSKKRNKSENSGKKEIKEKKKFVKDNKVKNEKILAIMDLMGIEGDNESEETENTKGNPKNKKKKN